MKGNKYKRRILLHKGIKYCTFFVMLFFFSLFLVNDTLAYDFKYSEFDWDTFYENKKGFWHDGCVDKNGNELQECDYEILKKQKKFYTKFYKLLAKYEKKGLLVPDSNIKAERDLYEYVDDLVLETVFYEMLPSQISDDSEEYNDTYQVNNGGYAIDESDVDDPDIDIDYNNEADLEYYAKETDTIKMLVSNLVAYTTTCYGIYGDPVTKKTSDGTEYKECENGVNYMNIPGVGEKCYSHIQDYSLGYWQYFVSKANHDKTLPWWQKPGFGVVFLGRAIEDENYNSCKAFEAEFAEGSEYVFNDNPVIDTNRYFDFLSYNPYFDGKAHLQDKFKTTILEPAGVDCMTADLCDNSLEAAGLYDEYEGEAILVRRRIIEDIIDILNNYGFEIDYDPISTNKYNVIEEQTAARKSFYWPIGSDETEERNGVIYADKDPASTEVIANFGQKENPSTGGLEEHYGIDIAGVNGVTNVIAVYRGEVISVYDSCVEGDMECNEGYGNTIILSHSNNDYTVYAHLASIDASVTVGSTVNKGQLIGKVGMTGNTDVACLHYEIRKGGNDVMHAVNPLEVSSADNPRPTVAEGDFSVHETSLTREEFASKLRQYCVNNSCQTTFMNVFVANAEHVYDVSVANNVNPELVVIRGAKEGMSPGGNTNNYWGIACYNGTSASSCKRYSSLDEGIIGFANTVSKYDTVSEMMSKYAYIGDVWYNPGSWSLGGCKYYSYISKYMSEERSAFVSGVCNSGPSCSNKSDSSCTPTNDEDQQAYAMYQASGMVNMRYVAFGL